MLESAGFRENSIVQIISFGYNIREYREALRPTQILFYYV